jgi:nicotinate-nucleotide adenylyltransferase
MKIAVFGGSFNPPHNGHVSMVKSYIKDFSLDKVLIIPAYKAPHKSHSEYESDEHRLNMCKIAFEGIEKAEVSDIEIKAGGISYTYLTLERLKKIYKNDELFLICGSDMFLTLLNWKNPEKIFEAAKIITSRRGKENLHKIEEYKNKLENLGAKILFCDCAPPPDSSTEVREKIKQGKSVYENVPYDVAKYIEENGLYR